MIRCNQRIVCAAFILVLLSGCGSEEPPPQGAPATQQAASTPEPAPAPTKSTQKDQPTLGHVRVVDLEGRTLPGMLPIVTTEPNAFNEPIAAGAPTNAEGESSVQIPADRAYYVRAWDPKLRLFANNFYTIQPSAGPETEMLEVVMVPAATLALVVLDKEAVPLVEQPLELMLVHPSQGPWWPARTVTDDGGIAVFTNLPPGLFNVQFNAGEAGKAGVESLMLPPGENTNAGVVTLK